MFSCFKKLNYYSVLTVFILLMLMILPASAAEVSAEVVKQYASLDPFSFILLEFGLIVVLALVGHILSRHYHLPNMMGELIIGIISGNILYWLDWSPVFYVLMHLSDVGEIFTSIWTSNLSVADTVAYYYAPDQPETMEFAHRLAKVFTTNESPSLILLGVALWIFSNIGVFMLLFKLGLETKTEEIIEAAEPLAFLVSATGTVVPFFLGFLVGFWLLPDATLTTHIFIAATLCTTSAAITTGMFSYLNKDQCREAKLVRHAAFLDDIFGMFFLSFITTIVLGDSLTISGIASSFLYSALFFVGIIFFGKQLVKHIPRYYNFDESHTRLLVPIVVMVLVSWLANILAVGVISAAFMSGMILNNIQDKRDLIKGLIEPLEKIFAPIFFVFVGMQVNLQLFINPDIFWLMIALLLVAILGKLAAGYVSKQGINQLAIGMGMIPRGEAVLIFISIGKVLGIIDDSIFSIIALIVLMTNFIAPWAITRLCVAKCHKDNFVIKE